MQVILLEKIDNLGDIGDQVKVKSGFGRNYLLPQGKAALATKENIAKLEAMRADLEAKAAEELSVAKERAAKIEGTELTISARAGTEGKLFGSVGTFDLIEAFEKAGVTVERSEIRLPEGPLRTAGEHQIDVHLHTDINVPVTVTVVGIE